SSSLQSRNLHGKDGTHREAAGHRDHWPPRRPSASVPNDEKDQKHPKTPVAASLPCSCPSPAVPYKTAPPGRDPQGHWRRSREQQSASRPAPPRSPSPLSSVQSLSF